MRPHPFNVITRTLVAAGMSLLLAQVAPAAIVANFTDGNDTAAGGANAPSVDSFPGAVGGGWVSAWSTFTSDASLVAGVENASPLANGGNYLNLRFTVASGKNTGAAGVHRRYSNSVANGGIDASQPHTISWKFRLNSPAGSRSATDGNDVIAFIDNLATYTGPGQTWAILAQGGLNAGRFTFINGNGEGGWSGIDTGIALANDKVYEFKVTIRPGATAADTFWDATISDGTQTFTQTGMRFRDKAAINDTGRIQFYGRNNGVNETLDFSIDSIAVSVPEPASMGFFGAALTLMAMRVR